MEENHEDSDGGGGPPTTLLSNRNSNHNSDQSEEEELVRNVKRRTEIFSDSDSELGNPIGFQIPVSQSNNSDWSSDEQTPNGKTVNNLKSKQRKSRIKNISSSEDSDSETAQETADDSPSNIKQSSRLNKKRINLQEKLLSLQKSREKHTRLLLKAQEKSAESAPLKKLVNSDSVDRIITHEKKNSENATTKQEQSQIQLDSDPPLPCVSMEFVGSDINDRSSSNEEEEANSIAKIKQKIKERSAVLKSTLLIDPDTSDEDNEKHNVPQRYKRKHSKQSSPKPARMSAKQAMENMQKIMSESNRMLREKDVSLPYHRPKALSLKDIMSRRKTVLTPDGKALPLKMNEEQLKLYAHSLEERQKEMIELCKSDTDDEVTSDNGENKSNDDKENIEGNNLISDSNDKKRTDVDTNKDDTTAQDNDTSFDLLINNEKQSDKQTADDKSEDSFAKEDTHEKNEEDTLKNETNEESCNTFGQGTNNMIQTLDNNTLEMDIDNQDNSKIFEQPNRENDEINSEELRHPSLNCNSSCEIVQKNTESESQLISLHYSENTCQDSEPQGITSTNIDTKNSGPVQEDLIEFVTSHKAQENSKENENTGNDNEPQVITTTNTDTENSGPVQEDLTELATSHKAQENSKVKEKNDTQEDTDVLDDIDNFSDDEINKDDIDRLIENADIIESTQSNLTMNSPMLIKDVQALTSKPRLAGAPGMVIDLDGCAAARPKLSGLELLKQRFSYFAQLKTPEEMERAREKQIKPGFQHLKLKHELEEKIAEQKSLEWAKRLEEEKQQHMEMDAIRGDGSDEEDDIDKMEAKLADNEENGVQEFSDSSESEPEENDMEITDKPRKSNPLLDNEAEESDCENDVINAETDTEKVDDDGERLQQNDEDESDEETSDEDSSDDNEEVNNEVKPRKGRILKAFEDSDDETAPKEAEPVLNEAETAPNEAETAPNEAETAPNKEKDSPNLITEEQDQVERNNSSVIENALDFQDDEIQSAQFQKSISEDIFNTQDLPNSQEKENGCGSVSKRLELNDIVPEDSEKTDKLSVICETQPYDDSKFDEIAGMCSGSFSQNIVSTQVPLTDKAATQEIGDEVLALCTGNFYDNQFGSQQEVVKAIPGTTARDGKSIKRDEKTNEEGNVLKSILEELDDPEFEDPKPNRFFLPNMTNGAHKEANGIMQTKKRFMIDSDDEGESAEGNQPKKLKKKKLKDRALQISDDEDEPSDEEVADDFISAEEEDEEADTERLVEYDSEENEVEVQVLQSKKKKRKMAEFFEQEAELTSEDEWVGSGDEDEVGLDRMEREEGDSDRFNQAALQRELGQIHMRDVLDQDKREVRMIQELLLEDGDLGGGSRQRKFRWRNADGEEEIGAVPDDLADTQEEDFESEEQWRKQRHEREVYLRQMMHKEEDNENVSLNASINRTAIIKANLVSKTMSSLLLEVNSPKDKNEPPVVVPEKKAAKDIPSPVKKPFNVLQQNYRGSLLSRGKGALARLAAIAAPLAGDSSEDAPKMGSLPKGKSNFVFATLSPSTKDQPKVSKRKNDGNVATPQLMKKMKTDEKREVSKMSLLEHLKT